MEAKVKSDAYLNANEVMLLIKDLADGYLVATDTFFKHSNKLMKPFVKQGVIRFDDETELDLSNHVICNVPGCQKEFNSVYDYESHYNTLHRYLCHICKKCLPTPHFLDLHILEQHDSYFSLLAEQKPMYSCFLEKCKHKSATPNDRKDHCIRTHKFPANFRFETSPPVSTDKKDSSNLLGTDDPMTERTKHNKQTVKNYSFGHQKQKAFDSRSYAKVLARKNIKDNRMDVDNVSALESSRTVEDLMDSLPN